MQQKIRTKFKELFNTEGSLYTSPGRINLIGEQDISLAYAGRLLNEVVISKVSIPYSLETYLWALECLLPPHWKVLMLSH